MYAVTQTYMCDVNQHKYTNLRMFTQIKMPAVKNKIKQGLMLNVISFFLINPVKCVVVT